MQRCSRISELHSSPLGKGWCFMEAGFILVWHCMDVGFFSLWGPPWLEGILFFWKKHKKAWKDAHFCVCVCVFIFNNLEGGKSRGFWKRGVTDQVPKSLFFSTFFIWIRRFVDEMSMSMIDFVDWLGSCLREECCFHFSLLIVAFCCPLYMPSVLGCVFLSGTVNIIFASLSKKEKKKKSKYLVSYSQIWSIQL